MAKKKKTRAKRKNVLKFTAPPAAKQVSLREAARACIPAVIEELKKRALHGKDVAAVQAAHLLFKFADLAPEPPKKVEPIEIAWVEIYQDDEGRIRRVLTEEKSTG